MEKWLLVVCFVSSVKALNFSMEENLHEQTYRTCNAMTFKDTQTDILLETNTKTDINEQKSRQTPWVNRVDIKTDISRQTDERTGRQNPWVDKVDT